MQDHERENEKKKASTFRSLAHCISVIGSFVHSHEREKKLEREIGPMSTLER